MKIGALVTLYNEIDYMDHCLMSIVDRFDHVAIVEGAYQETLATNPDKSPRSDDGTLMNLAKYELIPNVSVEFANELSDPQQRNIGLVKLIEEGCDWAVIVDADEVWDEDGLDELFTRLENVPDDITTVKLDIQVFVNDFWHWTKQTMSRCFRLDKNTRFVSDNEVQSYQHYVHWDSPTFWHYAYVKDLDRFTVKKNWWASRGGSDWFADKNGKYYSPNHEIWTYSGEHPEIMRKHKYYNIGR